MAQPGLGPLISLLVVGVIAVCCYHFNIWEGRKFLEIPRPLRLPRRSSVSMFLVEGHALEPTPRPP